MLQTSKSLSTKRTQPAVSRDTTSRDPAGVDTRGDPRPSPGPSAGRCHKPSRASASRANERESSDEAPLASRSLASCRGHWDHATPRLLRCDGRRFQAGSRLEFRAKAWNVLRTQRLEHPRHAGPSAGPRSASLRLGYPGGSSHSHKYHRKDAGGTPGRTRLRCRGGGRVGSGAPHFEPAPWRPRKLHAGSAGTLGAPGRPPAPSARLQPQRPAPASPRGDPDAPTLSRSAPPVPGARRPSQSRAHSPGEPTSPWNLNPAGWPQDGGRKRGHSPPAAPTAWRCRGASVCPGSGSVRPCVGIYSCPFQCRSLPFALCLC